MLTAAKNRIRYIYNQFDHVVVSFSGGKDSTAVLNLTIEVARELGRLPVRAAFFDEEAIHPPTIEYVERVRQSPDVKLEWYCLPMMHRNACSNDEPTWITWDPTKQDIWVRPLPENVITEHPCFSFGSTLPETDFLFGPELGKVAVLTGIRTQESLRRLKSVSMKKNDNYIAAPSGQGNVHKCHPIYDWSSNDVWRLVYENNYDYNKTYDVFNKTALYDRLLAQRVCPPYGEEPLRGLWIYAECFPEMWHKMLNRVPGVATAWRYGNTELYGIGKMDKPPGKTWREYTETVLKTYSDVDAPIIIGNVNNLIRWHQKITHEIIPESEPHILTGLSWAFLAKIAVKGDMKDRTKPLVYNEGVKARKIKGITFDQAVRAYGTEDFKRRHFGKKKSAK